MKTLATLFFALVWALPLIAATTTYPARTNGPNTFYGLQTINGYDLRVVQGGNSNVVSGGVSTLSKTASPTLVLSQTGVGPNVSTQVSLVLDNGGLSTFPLGTLNPASLSSQPWLLLSGGTVTGPVLTTSTSSNSPANLEFPTAGWVRDLFGSAGQVFYNSTNIAVGFTNIDMTSGTNFTYVTNIPLYATRTYVNPANGTYFSSVTTTNKFLSLNAGVEVSSYLSVDSGGSGTTGPLIKPEIYISYNGTNWLGDWDGPSQNIPEGSTNMYSWVIGNPNYVSTNATGFYVQRRFKMVTQPTPSASQVTLHIGGAFPSHIHLAGSTTLSGNAFLAVNQTFTGVNTFTQPINAFTSMTNILDRTNSQLQTVDFKNAAFSEGDFATNASFAWLGFIGLVSTQYQSTTIWLTNGLGTPITFTAPANCHTTGTLNCTNVTECVFKYNAGRWTNLLSLPLW